MSIKIVIKSTDVTPVNVTTKKGQTITLHKQAAWAFLTGRNGQPEPYPVRIELTLDRDNPVPYPVGDYGLHPSSFYAGSFGKLECSPRLAPVKSAAGA